MVARTIRVDWRDSRASPKRIRILSRCFEPVIKLTRQPSSNAQKYRSLQQELVTVSVGSFKRFRWQRFMDLVDRESGFNHRRQNLS